MRISNDDLQIIIRGKGPSGADENFILISQSYTFRRGVRTTKEIHTSYSYLKMLIPETINVACPVLAHYRSCILGQGQSWASHGSDNQSNSLGINVFTNSRLIYVFNINFKMRMKTTRPSQRRALITSSTETLVLMSWFRQERRRSRRDRVGPTAKVR